MVRFSGARSERQPHQLWPSARSRKEQATQQCKILSEDSLGCCPDNVPVANRGR